MKKFIILFFILLVCGILVISNPDKDSYTSFVTNQVIEKGIEPKIDSISEVADSSLFESIVNLGQSYSDEYLESTIELVIDASTEESNYFLFTIYESDVNLIFKTYHFKFIGIGSIFIPLELPEELS